MIRLFKHYIPYPVLFLGLFDFLLLVLAAELGTVGERYILGHANLSLRAILEVLEGLREEFAFEGFAAMSVARSACAS